MEDFTARTALVTGFHLIRRRPLLIALWAVLLLSQTVVFTLVRAKLFGEVQTGIAAGSVLRAFGDPLRAYTFGAAILSMGLAALLWASAFRAILRPADRMPLALGLEELCVFVSWLIINLLVAIVSAPLLIFLIGRFGVPGGQGLFYAQDALEVFSLLWSALASVWAFDRRRIALFRCWKIASGHFWVLVVLVVGVAVLDRLANAGVRELAPAPGLVPRLEDVLRAPVLLQDVLRAVIGALQIAFISGIVARAYRSEDPEFQADSFS